MTDNPTFRDPSQPERTAKWVWWVAVLLLAVVVGGHYLRGLSPSSWAFMSQGASTGWYGDLDPDLLSLLNRGEYGKLEETCRSALVDSPDSVPLLALLGKVLEIQGRYAEAVEHYEKALANHPDAYTVRLQEAELFQILGDRARERSVLTALVTDLRQVGARDAAEETVLGAALLRLERYHQSNEAFLRAQELDPRYIPALTRRAALFADKQDLPYAVELYKTALSIDPDSLEAMVGLATAVPDAAASSTEEGLKKVLEKNSRYLDAHNYLAVGYIQTNALDDAQAHLDKSLEVNPNYPETLGLVAAVAYFRDEKPRFQEQIEKIKSVSQAFPEVFNLMSELAARKYRYQEAADFARQALLQDERYWPAYANLGLNQLRLGDLAEGKQLLEIAFENDPFDVRVKNTLDLLDTLEDFETVEWERFRVLLPKQEAPIMTAYVRDLLDEVSGTLNAKFEFEPEAPTQIEIYPSHADFAVRTMGLPGIGALGACFGRVVVMDSPRAKKEGEFTWGSTLWHEYVHVLSLQRSGHRLPRWMSEGISVMEERRARPGWGDNLNLLFLQAIKEGQLLDIEHLDDGFHRPKSPFQIGLSYYQASKVCEYLESYFGWKTIVTMLDNYQNGWSTERVFKETLNTTFADFDTGFKEYLNREIGGYMEAVDFSVAKKVATMRGDIESLEKLLETNPREFFTNLELGKALYQKGRTDEAEQCWLRASEAFPYHGDEDSPYLLLADLYEKNNRHEQVIEQLEKYLRIHEGNHQIEMRLARLQLAGGRPADAEKTLMAAVYVNPFDASMHKLLGDVFLAAGKHRMSVREFEVLLALDPADKAGAYYDLSRAYLAAGLKAQAKSAVLKALEIAPSYAEAQDLLLRIVGE